MSLPFELGFEYYPKAKTKKAHMQNIRIRISRHLKSVPSRQRNIASWYFLIILIAGRRVSLTAAGKLSKMAVSSFSAWLAGGADSVGLVITELLCKAASQLSRNPIVPGAPWTIAIIIDATLQRRSRESMDNSQKFNHGKGWVVGHQWTNIIIFIDGVTLPLAPIPFYTKGYCKKHGIRYKSEHIRVRECLANLDLTAFLGQHKDSEVVVLMDSGYDDRDLYTQILMRGWDIVCSIRSSSHVGSKDLRFRRVDEIFKNAVLPWHTVYAFEGGWKKRKDFRARSLPVQLKGIEVESQVVSSEPRRDRLNSRRKYLYCSEPDIDVGIVVRTYRLRWAVEIFHRDIKSHLGMEDVSTHSFSSVQTHVRMVYAAYLFMRLEWPRETAATVQDKIRSEFEAVKFKKISQLTDRFGSKEQIKNHCSQVIEELMAA